jgi:hypothetical protein
MAGTTDARADAFDAAEFRDAIQFAMRMGSPNAVEDKVTFRWSEQKTYAVQDPDHKPYDWTEPPATDVTHPPVVLDEVAVVLTEPRIGGVAGTPVGQFDQVRAKITILDADFERIDGKTNPPDIVVIDGDEYEIRFISSTALFDVDIFEIHATAMDVN